MSLKTEDVQAYRDLARKNVEQFPEFARPILKLADRIEELETALAGAHRVIRLTRDGDSSLGELETVPARGN